MENYRFTQEKHCKTMVPKPFNFGQQLERNGLTAFPIEEAVGKRLQKEMDSDIAK